MSRLIDADKLENEFEETCTCECGCCSSRTCPVYNQPTAYDVEKVVAELKELPVYFSEGHWGEYLDKEKVIEIVKRGGIDGKITE